MRQEPVPSEILNPEWKCQYNDGVDFELDEAGAQDEKETFLPYTTTRGDQVSSAFRVPTHFDFVETYVFQYLVTTVILLNMITISIGLAIPAATDYSSGGFAANLDVLDQLILLFYCFELACRLGYWGGRDFFCHKSDWLWNWTDTAIVVVGVSLRWVVQVFFPDLDTDFTATATGMARCLRICKLLRSLKQASLGWTNSPWFQWLVATVISLNAVVMGIETDRPAPFWWWVDQGMLGFFMFEIFARIKLDGFKKFFTDPADIVWNLLDFTIVFFGVADLWMDRLLELVKGKTEASDSGGIGRLMTLVRMLRLARIIRLLKLVKSVKPLLNLAMGVTQAMQSIFWVLVLTMVTLYAFAILATRMVGHGIIIKDSDHIPEHTKMLFATIFDSMFTLFSVMNGNNWYELEPLLVAVPSTKPVFVIFTICSSWALLSVMTGVVSDHMMTVRESQELKDEQMHEERRYMFKRYLRGIFAIADRDGSDTLSRDEYFQVLQSPFHLKRIQQIANVTANDLLLMYDWLDVDGSGKVRFADFLRGFEMLNEASTGKSLLKIGHTARSHCANMKRCLIELRADADRLHSQGAAIHKVILGQLRGVLDARRLLEEERLRKDAAKDEVEMAREALAAAQEAVSHGASAVPGLSELRQTAPARARA